MGGDGGDFVVRAVKVGIAEGDGGWGVSVA